MDPCAIPAARPKLFVFCEARLFAQKLSFICSGIKRNRYTFFLSLGNLDPSNESLRVCLRSAGAAAVNSIEHSHRQKSDNNRSLLMSSLMDYRPPRHFLFVSIASVSMENVLLPWAAAIERRGSSFISVGGEGTDRGGGWG